MAISTLNNGESGLSIRTKINDNFTDVDGRLTVLGDASLLDVGTTAGTVAAGDDSRFGEVAIDDLDPGDAPDGTENVPVSQGGGGVRLTVEQVAGTPLIASRTHSKNRVRGYSDFSKTRATFAGTNGSLFDLEPYQIYLSGSGASCTQGLSVLSAHLALLGTGVDTTGYSGIRHTRYPVVFDVDDMMEDISTILIGGVLPATEAYTVQCGITSSVPSAVAARGMYFELTGASNEFFACVKNAGGTTRKPTGVTAALLTAYTLRVRYNPEEERTEFYINGALVETIDNSDRVVADATSMGSVMTIIKSAGSTSAILAVAHHYFDMPDNYSGMAYY